MTSKNQAMPSRDGADIENDAAGALKGGEAHRGDPETAPRPLGRKDPTVAKSSSRDDEGAPDRT